MRREYEPIPEDDLEYLLREISRVRGDPRGLNVTTNTLYRLAMELVDARNEIERLHTNEAVSTILAEELDDGDTSVLQMQWSDDVYLFNPKKGTVTSTGVTDELPHQAESTQPVQVNAGRRLPRLS
jgi:hypothetical protein